MMTNEKCFEASPKGSEQIMFLCFQFKTCWHQEISFASDHSMFVMMRVQLGTNEPLRCSSLNCKHLFLININKIVDEERSMHDGMKTRRGKNL